MNREQIKENVDMRLAEPPKLGGQSTGVIPRRPVILKSEELDLEIRFGYNRSQLKNKEMAYKLFESVLNEIFEEKSK